MTKIYNRNKAPMPGWGDPSQMEKFAETKELANRLGTSPDENPHGMTDAEIDRLDRKAKQMLGPHMQGAVSRTSTNRSALLQSVLPPGRQVVQRSKTAQLFGGPQSMGGMGQGGNSSVFTPQQPYLPEFEVSRQNFPVHRRLANTYFRMFAKMDPVVGAVIELFSVLPWGDFQLSGEGVDGSVKETLEYMIRETGLKTILPFFVSEFLTTGESIPHLYWDNAKGVWTHLSLHNPDQINVIYSPFLKMDPILEFVPDPKLREIVTSDHPLLARVRETMPSKLVSQLRAGENIALSPTNTSFIARKLHYYDLRGTSIQTRLWRTYMLEDSIWNATIATARRSSSPLKVAKLGDPSTGTIPGPIEEKRVLSLLAQAEQDPQAWLCVAPDTRITMADYTYKFAKDIVAGDKVLDRNGVASVVNAARKQESYETVRIKYAGGHLAEVVCTPDHYWPIFGTSRTCMCGCGKPVKKGNWLPAHGGGQGVKPKIKRKYWKPDGAPTKVDDCKFRFLEGFDPHQRVKASEVRRGDFLKIPRYFDAVETDVSPEMARLLGYYLAEGNITKKTTDILQLTLSFGDHEVDTHAKDANALLNELVPECGAVTYLRPHKSNASVQSFRRSGTELVRWLGANAGHYAKHKKLSEDVMRWPMHLKTQLLMGYLRGDGNKAAKSDTGPWQLEANTASKDLAYQLQLIFAQIGVYAPVYHTKQAEGSFGPGKDIYHLHARGRAIDDLLYNVYGIKQKTRKSDHYRYWLDDQYIYVKVEEVEHTVHGSPQEVVNISVEGDHSYLVGNVGTFNCYSYMIQFELAGAPERLMSINTHYDLIEKIKLIALGVSRSFISGESSYSSSAAGLTVFLQKLKSVRDFFVNEWLIPKYFLPVAIANEWIKPNKKSSGIRAVDEKSKYIIPDLEWAKSLDPQIDKEMIDAMSALEQTLGIKITDQKKYSSVGLDSEDQQKQLMEEYKFKKDLAGNDPAKQMLLGLAGAPGAEGGGGGGAPLSVSPGVPPEAFGMPEGGEGLGGGEGGGGEGPPPGGGEGVPPPTGGIEADAAKGDPTDTSKNTQKTKTPSGNKYWAESTIGPLTTFINTGDKESIMDAEPWVFALKEPYVKKALETGDKQEIWEAMKQFCYDENYPSYAIEELEHILAAQTGITKDAGITNEELTSIASQLGVIPEDSDRPDFLIKGDSGEA